MSAFDTLPSRGKAIVIIVLSANNETVGECALLPSPACGFATSGRGSGGEGSRTIGWNEHNQMLRPLPPLRGTLSRKRERGVVPSLAIGLAVFCPGFLRTDG